MLTTFGSLCDLIINKINLEHADTCTTQHAFYLLRNAIAAINRIDKCSITPHTRLIKHVPEREPPKGYTGDRAGVWALKSTCFSQNNGLFVLFAHLYWLLSSACFL